LSTLIVLGMRNGHGGCSHCCRCALARCVLKGTQTLGEILACMPGAGPFPCVVPVHVCPQCTCGPSARPSKSQPVLLLNMNAEQWFPVSQPLLGPNADRQCMPVLVHLQVPKYPNFSMRTTRIGGLGGLALFQSAHGTRHHRPLWTPHSGLRPSTDPIVLVVSRCTAQCKTARRPASTQPCMHWS
jgi:hypothetical protein